MAVEPCEHLVTAKEKSTCETVYGQCPPGDKAMYGDWRDVKKRCDLAQGEQDEALPREDVR